MENHEKGKGKETPAGAAHQPKKSKPETPIAAKSTTPPISPKSKRTKTGLKPDALEDALPGHKIVSSGNPSPLTQNPEKRKEGTRVHSSGSEDGLSSGKGQNVVPQQRSERADPWNTENGANTSTGRRVKPSGRRQRLHVKETSGVDLKETPASTQVAKKLRMNGGNSLRALTKVGRVESDFLAQKSLSPKKPDLDLSEMMDGNVEGAPSSDSQSQFQKLKTKKLKKYTEILKESLPDSTYLTKFSRVEPTPHKAKGESPDREMMGEEEPPSTKPTSANEPQPSGSAPQTRSSKPKKQRVVIDSALPTYKSQEQRTEPEDHEADAKAPVTKLPSSNTGREVSILMPNDRNAKKNLKKHLQKERDGMNEFPKERILRIRAKSNWRTLYDRLKRQDKPENGPEHPSNGPNPPQEGETEAPPKPKRKGCLGRLVQAITEEKDDVYHRDEENQFTQATRTMLAKERARRRSSKVVRSQQISSAYRRHQSGGQLGPQIPDDDHPLKAANIRKASYGEFTKGARKVYPSTYALPHDQTTLQLFGHRKLEIEEETPEDVNHYFHDHFGDGNYDLGRKHSGTERHLSEIRLIPGTLDHRRQVLINWKEMNHSDRTDHHESATKHKIANLVHLCSTLFDLRNFWHESIDKMEMNFGLSASTYFRWLRSVFLLNTLFAIISLSLIVFPEIHNANHRGVTFHSLILGETYRNHSGFFYGGYKYVPQSEVRSAFGSTAFRFLVLVYFIIVLDTVFIFVQIHQLFKRLIAKVSESEKAGEVNFFALILSAWNYNLISEQAVNMQHRTIARDFNEALEAYEIRLQKEGGDLIHHTTKTKSKWSIFRYWIINFGVLIVASGIGFGIFTMLSLRKHGHIGHESAHHTIIVEISTIALFVIAVNILSPICSWVSTFEDFETIRERNLVTVYRVALFYVGGASSLCFFWFENSEEDVSYHCWEDGTGGVIYRIMFFDTFFNIFLNILRYIIYPAIKAKCLRRKFERPDFDTVSSMLNLISVHILAGVGTFFCPLLPLFATIRLYITFYWKRFILNKFCAYPRYQIHPSELFTPYVVLFYLSYLYLLIFNTWLVVEMTPSAPCGPFAGYSASTYSRVIQDIVTDYGAASFFYFLFGPWSVYCAILILAGVVYTFRAWTIAYFETLNVLHDLLRLERLDREFLLRAMYSIPGFEQDPLEGDDLLGGSLGRSRETGSASLGILAQQQEALSRIFREHHGSHEGSEDSILSEEGDDDRSESSALDQSKRRLKHLMLSSKALDLLRKNPRRLSRAGNIYHDVVEKVIRMEHEHEHKTE